MVGPDHEPISHDDDAIRGRQDLAEQVGDEDGRASLLGEAPHEVEELARDHGVQARGRFIEDDELRLAGLSP